MTGSWLPPPEPLVVERAPEQDDRQVLFLVDPAWTATEEQPDPAPSNVVGGWQVGADGRAGAFEANPAYVPSGPGSPTDPVDGVLRYLSRGEPGGEDMLRAVVADARFEIAVDDEGVAIVEEAPDGSPVVIVVTAAAHAARLDPPGWRSVTAPGLAAALPDTGVDVLVNPGGPASMLLLASALRDATG